MIHFRHSATAQMNRQRHIAAVCSVFYAFLFLFTSALAAYFITSLSPGYDTGIEFIGTHFTPADKQEPPTKPKHPTTEKISPKITPALYLDTPELPTTEEDIPQTELALLDTPPEEEMQLETDAEALLQQPAKREIPPSSQKETPEKVEEYIPPAYRNCPKPPYPPAMRQRREEWIVGVLIEVNDEGSPTEVSITRPSGNHALDRHTRKWILKNWNFIPARRNGRNTPAQVSTELHYTLSR